MTELSSQKVQKEYAFDGINQLPSHVITQILKLPLNRSLLSEINLAIKQAQAKELLDSVHPNIFSLYLYNNLFESRDVVLKELEKYLRENQDKNPSFCLIVIQTVSILQNNYQILKGYESLMSPQFWYSLILKFIKKAIQKPSFEQVKFVQYFEKFLENSIIRSYIKRPNQKGFQIMKSIMQISASVCISYISKLRQNYSCQFIKLIQQNRLQNSTQSRKTQIFFNLKLIQLFHVADSTFKIEEFAKSRPFIFTIIYEALSDFSTMGANSLAINFYGAMLKQLDLFDEIMQAFVDLYLSLDSYGMHLVKDIWDKFYILSLNAKRGRDKCSIPNYFLLGITDLIHIVLNKVEQHPNHNVPKYCIQQLLGSKLEYISPLFEYLQDTVYCSIVQILNTGTHYNDVTHFHQDSKIYSLTKNFYFSYYSYLISIQKYTILSDHVKTLIRSMQKYITFEHCVIAFATVLAQFQQFSQNKNIRILGMDEIECLMRILQKFIPKLTIRKRFILFQSISKVIAYCSDISNISMQRFLHFAFCKASDKFVLSRSKRKQTVPRLYSLIIKWDINISQFLQKQQECLQLIQKQLFMSTQQQILSNIQKLNEYIFLVKKKVFFIIIKQEKFNDGSISIFLNQISQKLESIRESSYMHPLTILSTLYSIISLNCYNLHSQLAQKIKTDMKFADLIINLIAKSIQNKIICIEWLQESLQLVASQIQQSNSSLICRSYAKFIQFILNNIMQKAENQRYLPLFILAIKYKGKYTKNYRSIEDSLYKLSQQFQQTMIRVPAKERLRIQFLLFNILSHDFQFAFALLTKQKWCYVQQMRQYFNLYDYEHYEQVFSWIGSIAAILSKAASKKRLTTQQWLTFQQNICGNLQQLIKIMLHNLQYGINSDLVISCTQIVAQVVMILKANEDSLKLVEYVLTVGQKNWGFQRNVILCLLKSLQKASKIQQIQKGAIYLILRFIQIEEYRGQDSALLLTEHNQLSVYRNGLLDQRADYDGTALRFITIEWAKSQMKFLIDNKLEKSNSFIEEKVKLWMSIFQQCFRVCLMQNGKQRMFLTGNQSKKLKYCQFLITFPQFLLRFDSQSNLRQHLLLTLQSLNQNNLTETKYYLQIFMMKILYLVNSEDLLNTVSQKLMKYLLNIEGQSSLIKNVTFMVISGLVLQQNYHHGLFSVLFSSICSHIAYFRGLSQYFCYNSNVLQNLSKRDKKTAHYVKIMHNQFLKDKDAVRLAERLEKIISQYKDLIKSWNIYDNLLKLKPTVNNQVIGQGHYVDKLKYLGHELVKEHKHEDGFMLYRDSWKKILNQKEEQREKDEQKEKSTFQRKIDPSLDNLYDFQALNMKKQRVNNLKVVVVSAQHIAFYGHMARVGQILGISELIIPSLKIIDDDEFSNVSVTAQKWLKISEHKFQKINKESATQKSKSFKQKKGKEKSKPKPNNIKITQDEGQTRYEYKNKANLIQMLRSYLLQGYSLYEINKQDQYTPSLNKIVSNSKAILIVDQLEYLQNDQVYNSITKTSISFNRYFSYHVEASIFIWSYFKQYSLENSRPLEKPK